MQKQCTVQSRVAAVGLFQFFILDYYVTVGLENMG